MTETLLIVDDDLRVLHAFSRNLRLYNLRVVTASEGREAMALYERHAPDFVLCDLRMPGMSGLDVLNAIRARDPDADVILTTGHGDRDAIIEALRSGVSDFVPKPVDSVALEAMVQRARDRLRMRRKLQETQEALQASEARYRAVSDLSSDFAFAATVDAGGELKMAWVTDSFERITGYTPEEARALGWFGFVHPRDLERARERFAAAFAGEDLGSNQLRIITKAGSVRWLVLRSRPVWNDVQTQVLRVIGAARDITQRKLAEEALRQHQEQLEELVRARTAALEQEVAVRRQAQSELRASVALLEATLEATADGIITVDRQQRVIVVNRNFEEIWGFPPGWIMESTLEARLDRMRSTLEAPETFFQEVRALYATPEAITHDVVRLRDGRVYEYVSAPYRIEGEIAGRVWSFHEITEQQRARQALVDSHANLELNEARLEALLKLQKMLHVSMSEIADYALHEAVALTGSTFGFFGFVDEAEEALALHTWSDDMMAECEVDDLVLHFPFERAGVWAEAIRRREPIVINDYASTDLPRCGYPEGHVRLERLISLPVFQGGAIVAVLAVANKLTDYDAADLRQVTLLAEGLWQLVQQREAEAALRESEARFRLLAENARDLIYRYRVQPEPGFEYVSPAATAITGYTPEDHYANPQLGYELVHPDDRHLLAELAQGEAKAGEPVILRWVRKDGRVIWTEQQNTMIYDDAGELIAIEGIARDITARREAEMARGGEPVDQETPPDFVGEHANGR